MWTNFAKTGDPNLPTSPNIGCSWTRQTAANKQWASVDIWIAYLFTTDHNFYMYVHRYLRIGADGLFSMELGPDYQSRVNMMEEIMNTFNYTFGLNW